MFFFEEKVMVNIILVSLVLGAAVIVRDFEEWKTGSCKRVFLMLVLDVDVVRRVEKKIGFVFL